MPIVKVGRSHLENGGRIAIVKLLTAVTSFCPSNGEARRLIEGGGVELDGKRVDDVRAEVELRSGAVLRAGKKKFAKLELE